jgi:methylenetetrahydrofolate dehydrogenase (NADP+)/methenyltetrahydrofolate cyclohydrolase
MLAEPIGRGETSFRFFAPATPSGGVELMRRNGIEFSGKHVVIVGRSAIVGKPLSMLLLRENATVTICHSRTNDLQMVCRQADILCVAVGRPEMVRGDWIREGAVVIDFGINEVEGRMVGDVAYDEAALRASAITPVPGGTGPMTNAMLCQNLLQAVQNQPI